MFDLIKLKPIESITIAISGGGFAVAAVLYALHKLGWIKMPRSKTEDWDGHERRECAQHSGLNQKVCSLYEKLDDVEVKLGEVVNKLGLVSENVQYLLGLFDKKWRKQV